MLRLCFLLSLLLVSVKPQGTKQLQELIEEKEKLVAELAAAAEKVYAERSVHLDDCTCTRHSCSNDVGKSAQCLGRLRTLPECGQCAGSLVDYSESVVRIAPGTHPNNMTAQQIESICTFKALDPTFRKLGVELWTFVGTLDGTHRVYPTRHRTRSKEPGEGEPHFQKCTKFDPRLRPWYVLASTGPKDVVLLIDTSGSMLGPADNPRWDLTRTALETLLDTFTPVDYVNIVTFSDEAEPLVKSRKTPLLQATEKNREKLKKALPKVVVNGGTDFNKGFQRAFDLLEEAAEEGPDVTSSGCTKIIIFLTDGRDCSTRFDAGAECSLSLDEGPEKLLDNIEKRQRALEKAASSGGSRASIFTFSMGADADDSIPRQIACGNEGTWSSFEDGSNPLLRLNSYYSFIGSARFPGTPSWAEPHEDASGLGLTTGVSQAIYSPPGNNGTGGVQIGVVGHDLDLVELEVDGIDLDTIFQELATLSCVPAKLEPCRLQAQRDVAVDHGTCPDRLPKKKCYEFMRRWYRRFDTPLDRDDAQAECKAQGGNLVSIRSDDHLSFVASLSAVRGSWVGAKRIRFSPTNEFVWEDESVSSIDETSDYWGAGEPHDEQQGGENCAIIDPRGVKRNMDDELCDNLYSFICEFEEKPIECRKAKDIVLVDPRSFFEVPPLNQCRDEEDVLGKVGKPLGKSFTIPPEKALCPLGKQKDFEDLVCCKGCPDEDDFDQKRLGWPLKNT